MSKQVPPERDPADYVPVYYPNVIEPSTAAAISITPTTVATINLDVGRHLSHRIRGRIVNANLSNANPLFFVLAPINRNGVLEPMLRNRLPRNSENSFELWNVVPGIYDLYSVGTSGYGRKRVTVGSEDLTDVTVLMKPGVGVQGRVYSDDGGVKDLTTLVMLIPEFANLMPVARQSAQTGRDGSFTLSGLPDVDVRLSIRPPKGTYISRATLNGIDVLHSIFRIEQPSRLEIELRRDGASVVGSVLKDGQPVNRAAWLVLAPIKRPGPNPRFSYLLAQTRNGAFALELVPPGDYVMYAFEPGLSAGTGFNRYYDDAFLGQFSGVRLHLSTNTQLRQDVELVPLN